MKILVTGYSGQLGYDVVQEGLKRGFTMDGIRSVDVDITDEEKVYTYVTKTRPDAIIHCAAYTAVDQAEDDQETCWNVNVNGTKHLASIAHSIHAKLMYMSTDYVFDGEGKTPFSETDNINPVGYYGLTKAHGEKVVKEVIEDYFIVRISWVFGWNGNNFVKTMLRLSESRDELKIVGDQFGSPTYTFDLARLLIDMIQTDKYGVYHASNEGFCSWAEFASEIFHQAGKKVKIRSIPTEDYPTRATRPKNSKMSKQKLIDNGFKPLPKWQDALKHYLSVIEVK